MPSRKFTIIYNISRHFDLLINYIKIKNNSREKTGNEVSYQKERKKERKKIIFFINFFLLLLIMVTNS